MRLTVAAGGDFTVQPNSCLGGKLGTTFSAPGDTEQLLSSHPEEKSAADG
jgi:hypothetical protein